MKLHEAVKRLVQLIVWDKKEENMQLPEDIQKLLFMIENTQEVELPCDDVYYLLDQYTEVFHEGRNVIELMPLVEHHIDICPDCREEFEALLRILQANPA